MDRLDDAEVLAAQEAASPYIALWNRVADFDPADLDRAFADRSIVKASLMRMTLHAVDAADYAAFHRLSKDAWAGLAAEAHDLVAFLADRDPAVYRRYGHWWDSMKSAEVRILPG